VGVLAGIVLVGFGLGGRHSSARQAREEAALAAPASPDTNLARRPPLALAPAARTTPAPAARDPVAVALAGGLLGYWRFDDGGGSPQARDLSGNGNDCTLRRMDPGNGWTDGPLGGALSLGGSGWLACGHNDGPGRATGELTVALWVRRAGERRRVQALVSRQLDRDSRDLFHFGFRDDLLILQSAAWHVTLAVPYSYPSGRWVHVAGVLGRDRRARIYLDGREVKSKRTGLPPTERASTPLIIGGGVNAADQVSVGERFEGALDELLVYDRALSPDELAALAASTQPQL
jgi:hypothetical protein